MNTTIPKKALVALPDFKTGRFTIVPPEEAQISVFDRSFHFGDSLYEVTRSYDGVLFSLEEHMVRLRKSCEYAMFEALPDFSLIKEMVRETCRAYYKKFGNSDVYVRITLSRGMGDLNIDRGYASQPYAFVFVKELAVTLESAYQQGVHYALVERRRNLRAAIDPAMKSGNYLNNVLALAEAKKMGAQDAVMLNYQGFVTEGTTNNFYMAKNGEIWTAPLEIGILKGITRDWIFEQCRLHKIPIQERLFTAADLAQADEMFFSSATKEVMPITKLSGQPVGDGKPGPLAKKLRALLQGVIKDYGSKHKGESLYV